MARESPRKALQMLPIKDSGPRTPGPISVHPVTGHLPGGTVLDTWAQSQGGFMGLVCPALPTGLPGRCGHQVHPRALHVRAHLSLCGGPLCDLPSFSSLLSKH